MLELVRYKDTWNREFEEIKKDILSCVGDRVLRVDHIGSTAIPGMIAKDTIDIQIGVAGFEDVPILADRLSKIEFEYLPHIIQDHAPGHEFEDFVPGWEKRFFKATEKRRSANVHVRLVTGENFAFALLFRDYLRQNTEAARAYEQVKHRLAQAVGQDVKAYTLIKDPVCDLIFMLAKKWASESSLSR